MEMEREELFWGILGFRKGESRRIYRMKIRSVVCMFGNIRGLYRV